jgi:ABC-type phosphate transport system substrate-binding protein
VIKRPRLMLYLLLLPSYFLVPASPIGMAQGGDDFVIIVHPSIPGTQITESSLKGIYLRDVRKWGASNMDILPVELEGEESVRAAFHTKIFSKTAAQMKAYWVNLRLSKNVPLPVAEQDSAAAKKFVAENKGAIAYVNPAQVDSSVKVLKLIR